MSEAQPVRWESRGRVGLIVVNSPPVNALSHAVREGIMRCLDEIDATGKIDAVVLHCEGRTFIAGADISEFGTPKAKAEPTLRDLCARLDAYSKPVTAAIHGTALGGGLELAMSCHYRVANSGAMVGLPEVKLGLLPGAGGTQRLPRAVGPEAALDMIVSGKPIGSKQALELSLIDKLLDDLLAGALSFAEVHADDADHPRLSQRLVTLDSPDAFFEQAETSIRRKARGREAPLKILECIRAACDLPFDQGLTFERARFQELYDGPQRQALIHQFFAEREAAKIPDLDPTAAPQPIERAGVVGAGVMGGGIAMCLADAGIDVALIDRDEASVEAGMERIRSNYGGSVKRARRTQESVDVALARVATSTDYDALSNVDLVIEAAYEDMDVKLDIFRELDRVTPPHAILATNTSALDIDAIAAATTSPERVVGTHFFSPANVMRLLENVRATATSDQAIATVMALGKRLKKVAVLAGNCDGFIGNRMYQFYMYESEFLVEEGATPEQIDGAMESFGNAMGPLAVRDLSGVDVGWMIKRARLDSMPDDERYSPILERLYDAGRLGQKTQAGIYRYDGRKRIPDPEFAAMVATIVAEGGIEQRSFSNDEIVSRLLHPLVNEGARVLQDGVALRASDIDVVYVNGYGFPAHRGGPMYWAMQQDLDAIVATCEAAATRNGSRWAPCELLVDRAKSGKPWD